MAHGARSCEKETISRKDAKAQRLAKSNCFVFFAPLREMLLLIQGLFHSFCRRGPQSIGPEGPEQAQVQGKLNEAEYTAYKVFLKTSKLKVVLNEKVPGQNRDS